MSSIAELVEKTFLADLVALILKKEASLMEVIHDPAGKQAVTAAMMALKEVSVQLAK